MGASSGGLDGMANENVTGFYFDDYWAESGEGWASEPMNATTPALAKFNASDCNTVPSEYEGHCLLDMGLSAQDVEDITL
jgi:hypothetical protein